MFCLNSNPITHNPNANRGWGQMWAMLISWGADIRGDVGCGPGRRCVVELTLMTVGRKANVAPTRPPTTTTTTTKILCTNHFAATSAEPQLPMSRVNKLSAAVPRANTNETFRAHGLGHSLSQSFTSTARYATIRHEILF